MVAAKVVAIASVLALSNAADCVYRVGTSPIELDLFSLKGQRFFYQDPDSTMWGYSPCNDGFQCSHDGKTVNAMVDHVPVGVNECFPWATYDLTVKPFYNFGVASFVFNYSNGEVCPDSQQENRTTTIIWTCDSERGTPVMVDAYHYDECNVLIELKWEGACTAPPPSNEDCEFTSGLIGGSHLNLSSVKGNIYTLSEQDKNGNNFYYEFSPCSNAITCYSAQSGRSYPVMADVRDSGKQCAKYLGVWSGDAQPFYDKTIFGQDYWDFFWMNGEQCGEGGPLEVLNVRYYCNPKISSLVITKGYSNGPCQFRIEIDSNLACKNATSNQPESIKRLHDAHFG